MRRKCLLGTSCVVLMFIVVALFAGCTTTYHYEKDAPIETQATLKWMGKEIKTVALDEVGTNWKVKSFMFGSFGQCIVYLPPGPHTLTVNYKEGGMLTSRVSRADALHVGQNFLPGRTYNLTAQRRGNSVEVSITEVPAGQGGK